MKMPTTTRTTVIARSRARALVLSAGLVAGLVALPCVVGRRVEASTSVPAAAVVCPGPTYTVLSGDYWIRIATKNGVTLAAVLAANHAVATTVIHPGQIVCLPASAVTTTAAVPTTVNAPGPVVILPGGVLPIKQFPVQGLCWFSDSWGAPRSGGRRHEGVDLITKMGQKIYAVDDGVLTKRYIDAPGSLSGNGWRLTRADGTYFFYAHLSAFADGLMVGSPVVAGQIIGLVGMTGAAGTPHLHFEVHPGGGAPINPTPTVTAVNGCKITAIPAQPAAVAPVPTTTVAPATTIPATTIPATTTTTVASLPPLAPTANSRWTFIAPQTVLDTNGAPMTAGAVRTVAITGARGSLAGVPAVLVRLVARSSMMSGHLKLYACGAAVPEASALNYVPDRVNATVLPVPTGPAGVCVAASSSVDVRIEVLAYASSTGVGLQPMDSNRALDTRLATPLAAGAPITLPTTRLGVPASATAVTVSVTLLTPTAPGSISVGPCGGTPWTLAYGSAPSQMIGGVVRVNGAGLCLSSTTTVHVVVDVTGVWVGAQPLVALPAMRLFDSRLSEAISSTDRRVPLTLPAGTTRAQLSIVVIGSPSSGAVYAWNCNRPRPVASVASSIGPPTSVTVTMDVTGGAICLASSRNVQVVIDVFAVG